MQQSTSCFLQVFGFEEDCGGEGQLLAAIRTLPEVRIGTAAFTASVWSSRSPLRSIP